MLDEFEVAPAVDPEKRNFLLRVAGMMVDKDTNDTVLHLSISFTI